MTEKITYNVTCSREKFNILKMDERFSDLLTLARVVNALHFCHKASTDARNTIGPVGAMSQINSFLFAASVLYEGFLLVEKLAKKFKKLDSFKAGFGVLLREKTTKSYRESVLKRIRNKLVFHFDQNVVKESFKNFELQQYNFASRVASGDMYFGLADEAVINYLLQPTHNESEESLKQRYEKILQNTRVVMDKFIESTEMLMAGALDDMGFTKMAYRVQ